MALKEKVEELLQEAIQGKDIFLVDLKVTPSNSIQILVDTIEGITIDQCVEISRHIEHNLDRDEQDFELQVSSPGLDVPLKIFEQYKKNVGRELNIQLSEGKTIKGKLIKAEKNRITLETSKKERIEGRKKKQVIKEEHNVDLSDIISAKIIISFK